VTAPGRAWQFRPVDFQAGKLGEPRFAGLLLSGAGAPLVIDLGPDKDRGDPRVWAPYVVVE
jgi:hypothetical protein